MMSTTDKPNIMKLFVILFSLCAGLVVIAFINLDLVEGGLLPIAS